MTAATGEALHHDKTQARMVPLWKLLTTVCSLVPTLQGAEMES